MMEKFKMKFFCCCTLKTGCLVIGTLGWLITLFQLFYLTNPLRQEQSRYKNSETDIAAEISYSIITLIVCVLMIYGVYKNNKRFILPWLVLKCMECLAWTIITFIILVLFLFEERIWMIIFLFFIIFFVTTLNWFFWICVWSLYMELDDTDEQNNQNIQMNKVKTNEDETCPIAEV